ncbi:hypothetical protein [Foetidibacter luteolus]|uniref:hypothetical protein n=1 Tax=Foetidibacter luteolus TaxID=2608880 RepID=UPI00129B5E47|nr:hypothetical protein [Foetidibacter luteolus]
MKKIFIAAFTLATLSAAAHGTAKKTTLFIPATVSSSFNANFPDVSNPSWSWDQQYLKATFVEGTTSANAFFSSDGTLEGTIKSANFYALPASAQEHINNKYKDYTVEETILFTDNDPYVDSRMFGYEDSPSNYFVSLKKDNKELILKVDLDGSVSYYHEDTLKGK